MGLHQWGSLSSEAGTLIVPGQLGGVDERVGTPGDENLWEMPSEDATLSWFIGTSQTNNASAPHNQALNQGWNCSAAGTPVVAGEPVLRDSYESNFLTGGQRYMERHWQYIGADGSTTRRAISVAINRSSHAIGIDLNGDLEVFESTGATQTLDLNESGFLETFGASGGLSHGTNNVGILFGRDSGANSRELVRLDNTTPGRLIVDNGQALTATRLKSPRTEFYAGNVDHGAISSTEWSLLHALCFGYVLVDTISGDQNNYNPSAGVGLANATVLMVDGGAADRNITGLAGGLTISGTAARIIIFINNGTTNNIVLVHESASSTAANRFNLASAANVTIAPRGMAILAYASDGSSARWRGGVL